MVLGLTVRVEAAPEAWSVREKTGKPDLVRIKNLALPKSLLRGWEGCAAHRRKHLLVIYVMKDFCP